MLEVVHIRDYALIDALDIEFQPGFNVLTGETGAGKSIVVGALGLALGARASAEAVRSGTERASVEAVFRLDKTPPRLDALLDSAEIALDEGLLILTRTVTADGRSRAQINGRHVTITTLAAIGDELVDLHGQHEHQSLLRADCQMELLDAFADTTDLARAVAAAVVRTSQIKREIEALESDDRDRARQVDFLRYEINEIDQAHLTPGEEEELRARIHLITNAETIYTLANTAYAALYESESQAAIDALDTALNALEELAHIDERFEEQRAQTAETRACMENVAAELREFTSRMEFDPKELDELNQRLAAIGDLKRKYGANIDAILAYRDRAAASLADYDNRDERLAELRADWQAARNEAEKQATTLSKQRRQAATTMDAEALKTLRSLDMPGASFATLIEETALCANGIDKIAFMLSANAGEPLKPLRQVASGGEISRIMLALKAVFAEQDTVPTLIFDEIDAGIGGATARRIADKMRLLATRHQVLCISHLAQIAASANAHYAVMKKTREKRTSTEVATMTGETREQEIARLLDGSVSEVSLEHARALLAEFTVETTNSKKRKRH